MSNTADKTKPAEEITDIGWMNSWNDSPPGAYHHCHEQQHKVLLFDNSLEPGRGTDIISVCTICKILWHTDMSD